MHIKPLSSDICKAGLSLFKEYFKEMPKNRPLQPYKILKKVHLLIDFFGFKYIVKILDIPKCAHLPYMYICKTKDVRKISSNFAMISKV